VQTTPKIHQHQFRDFFHKFGTCFFEVQDDLLGHTVEIAHLIWSSMPSLACSVLCCAEMFAMGVRILIGLLVDFGSALGEVIENVLGLVLSLALLQQTPSGIEFVGPVSKQILHCLQQHCDVLVFELCE
jgi:hypothetical protein